MVKKYILKISNDLELPVNYDVFTEGKLRKSCVENGLSQYQFEDKEGSAIRVYKENKWAMESKINTIFMFLFVLDLIWGNIMESDNLPIGADIQIILSQDNDIKLSNILKTTTNGIKRWIKGAYIQYMLVFIIILFVSFVLFMTCPFPLNVIVCALIATGTIFLFVKARTKLKKTKSMLEK